MEKYSVLKGWKNQLVKMAKLPKAICSFSAFLIKIPMSFFKEIEREIIRFVWNHKRPRTAKATLREKKEAGESAT